MCCCCGGGGLVVSVHSFFPNYLSSSPADIKFEASKDK